MSTALENIDPSEREILAVDDQEHNLIIMEEYLGAAGYRVSTARDGDEAWDVISLNPRKFDLILLDWMMPGLSGLEILKRTRLLPEFKLNQIIMQTARARKEEIEEGIRAGAWYYLTKPFSEDTLLAIVKTALVDRGNYLSMQEVVAQKSGVDFTHNQFSIRGMKEAGNLAGLLATLCPDPGRVVTGFLELLLNAIEHGNLGITYEEKTGLIKSGAWYDEVVKRLASPEHRTKTVKIKFWETDDGKELKFLFADEGSGFQWEKYLHFDPDRIHHTHGRGIAMSRAASFNNLEYQGNGNTVIASVSLQSEEVI